MGVNITVDGLTYGGVEQMYVGGKSLALSADAGVFNADYIALKTLSEAYGQSAPFILISAFQLYTSLQTASFPAASEIRENAFYGCASLEQVFFPSLQNIGNNAFGNCVKLKGIQSPLVVSIGYNAFMSCSALQTVDFPLVTAIETSTFVDCHNLSSVNLPEVTTISSQAFVRCSKIGTLSFPKITSIANLAFFNCAMLLSFYIMQSSVVYLSHSNAFRWTPIDGSTASTGGVLGSIYVPASLLTAYQSATNWAFFSERFVGV